MKSTSRDPTSHLIYDLMFQINVLNFWFYYSMIVQIYPGYFLESKIDNKVGYI